MKITAQELREILFEVENQDLTIKELRDLLYQLDDQEETLTARKIYELTK